MTWQNGTPIVRDDGVRAVVLDIRDLGYWIRDQYGATYLLQHTWCKSWTTADKQRRKRGK